MFTAIQATLRDLYLTDPRPWLVGFSGGKDSTMVAALIFEAIASLPEKERTEGHFTIRRSLPPCREQELIHRLPHRLHIRIGKRRVERGHGIGVVARAADRR